MNSKKIFVFIKAFRKKFNEVGIYKESAALTFVTLLGFIPFIIFLLFFLPELPFLKMGSKFGSILETIFIPESAQQIAQYISEIANQKISFNLFSFTVLLVTSYSLFKIINSSFDDILNVHETRKRGILYNFVKFFWDDNFWVAFDFNFAFHCIYADFFKIYKISVTSRCFSLSYTIFDFIHHF